MTVEVGRGVAGVGGVDADVPPGVQRVLARLALWPVAEADRAATDAAVVSDLRRATGRFPPPRDGRLAALIRDLNAGNKRFAELWAAGEVAAHREDHKTIDHPSVGPVTVDCDVLTDGDSELKIVIGMRAAVRRWPSCRRPIAV